MADHWTRSERGDGSTTVTRRTHLRTVCGALAATLAASGLVATAAGAAAAGQNGTTLTAYNEVTANLVTTYGWSITKAVSPDTLNLFAGDTADVTYTVVVTKDAGTTSAWLDGRVCVTNGGEVATENLAIVENATVGGGKTPTPVGSVTVDVSGNPVLDPGEVGCYTYRIPVFSPEPGALYKVTADITITNHSGSLGTPTGPGPADTATMPSAPTLVNDAVTVEDTNGTSWDFADSGSVSYSKTFSAADAGRYDNTATITQTGQSATASVNVNVFRLSATKTANASFDRSWAWTVDKSADQSSLTLQVGQTFPVNYTVVVNAAKTDSNYAVAGTITVANPAPMAADLTSMVDAYAGSDATVSCPSMLVPAGGSLACTYSVGIASALNGTNTATVTQQNHAYAADGSATASGTTDYFANATVTFGATPATETDECVSVTDTLKGALGGVCAGAAPKTFTYTLNAGPYAASGPYSIVNVATATANDSHTTTSDSATVNVLVPSGSCTLTQGYWKTHSTHGPAKYDDGWLAIGPSGADTMFYSSGQTYYQVLLTAPQGNAYYILADQYIAASLNILGGAPMTSDVKAAMDGAKAFFESGATPSSSMTKAQKTQLTTWAGVLNNYNNGLIGPGHCSE